MIKKERDGIVWFEFEKLQIYPRVRHAIFSRLGGESSGAYKSLNLSYHVGDDEANVRQNRQQAFACIGLDTQINIVQGQQVHHSNVHAVLSIPKTEETIANCDAFMTNVAKVALTIQHADCQVAIFYDPIQQALACVHAGWRGSVCNIYKETIRRLNQDFGSKPESLIVGITPSLGPEKAEFINFRTELPETFCQFKNLNHYFDFWKISRWQLESEGILPENIEIAALCTATDQEHFFSYRRDKICGRHLTTAWLRA